VPLKKKENPSYSTVHVLPHKVGKEILTGIEICSIKDISESLSTQDIAKICQSPDLLLLRVESWLLDLLWWKAEEPGSPDREKKRSKLDRARMEEEPQREGGKLMADRDQDNHNQLTARTHNEDVPVHLWETILLPIEDEVLSR